MVKWSRRWKKLFCSNLKVYKKKLKRRTCVRSVSRGHLIAFWIRVNILVVARVSRLICKTSKFLILECVYVVRDVLSATKMSSRSMIIEASTSENCSFYISINKVKSISI